MRAILFALLVLALGGCTVTAYSPYPYEPAYAYPGYYYRTGPYYYGRGPYYYHRPYYWHQFP